MRTLLIFLGQIETIVYVVSAIGIFFSIRALSQARVARRNSVFGLEREAADNKQTRAISTILALTMLSGGVFIMVRVVTPTAMTLPDIRPTPTQLIVFTTQSPTPTESRLLFPTITPTPGLPPVAGAAPPPTPTPGAACDLQGARVTSPISGQTVTGQVVVQGGANILNFQKYKFEIRGASTNQAWVVVADNNVPVVDPGLLGTWDSTSLAPGPYVLRLVVLRVDGTFPTPCEVPITIASPGEQLPPSPTPQP